MRNIRIAYTVTMAEIPQEIDALMEKLKSRAKSMVTLMDSISFQDDQKSALEMIHAVRSRLEDLGTTLYDCEDMAQGLVDLQNRLAPPPAESQNGGPDVDVD